MGPATLNCPSSCSSEIDQSLLEMPIRVLPLCRLLDVMRVLNIKHVLDNDYRRFGELMGFPCQTVALLGQEHDGPTRHLLEIWSQNPANTVGRLLSILRDMDREDICHDLCCLLQELKRCGQLKPFCEYSPNCKGPHYVATTTSSYQELSPPDFQTKFFNHQCNCKKDFTHLHNHNRMPLENLDEVFEGCDPHHCCHESFKYEKDNRSHRGFHNIHADMCFYLKLLAVALLGIFYTLHRYLRSAYHGPIDWGPVSVIFLLLSFAKEVSLYFFVIYTIQAMLHSVIQSLLVHLLVGVLLVVEIIENKTVSHEVHKLRKVFIQVTVLRSQLQGTYNKVPVERQPGAEEVEQLQASIGHQLVVYLSVEFILLVVSGMYMFFQNSTLAPCLVSDLHHIVYLLCLSETLFTAFLWVRHYRRHDYALLHGRFRLFTPDSKDTHHL